MTSECTTIGDGDLYGLGVRIGLYLQWMAGFLLRNFNGSWKTVSAVRITSNAICFSLVLTLVIDYAKDSALSTDFLIVYYLTIALFYSESYNLLEKGEASTKTERYVLRPDVPLILQNFVFAFTSFFGAWFWINGIHQSQSPSCVAKAACFGIFDLNGSSWRNFAATMTIFAGLIFSLFFTVHLVIMVSGQSKSPAVKAVSRIGVKVASALNFSSGSANFRFDIVMSRQQRYFRPKLPGIWKGTPSPITWLHWVIMNVLGSLIAIVSVERMVHANHLQTPGISSSSGQMMALLTGVSSICMALSDIVKSVWNSQSDVAEDVLSSHAYYTSRPLEKKQIRQVALDLMQSACGSDPAFLEEAIQKPGTMHSKIQTYPTHLPERTVADLDLHCDIDYSDPCDNFDGPPTRVSREGIELGNAIIQGQIEKVKLLLSRGANPNSRDKMNRTPLLWASSTGNVEVTKVLLDTGRVDLNCTDDYNQTPCWWAAVSGHESILQLLFAQRGIGINVRDSRHGRTPLACAARTGNESIFQLLLAKRGVDLESTNLYGQTPLSEAAEEGHAAIVEQFLSKKGVNANSKDIKNRTPLCWAAINGHEAVANLLLASKHVNPVFEDIDGQTPLIWAAKRGHMAVAHLLVGRRGIHPDSDDKYTRTPLCWAAMRGHEPMVKLLIGLNASPDVPDRHGRTPLFWAAMRGHEAVVDLLLKIEGVDVNSRDMDGRTPLHWAVLNGHEAVVALLLPRRGARVEKDLRDKHNQSPLFIALKSGDKRISERLLRRYQPGVRF